jgi:hypothetical protein
MAVAQRQAFEKPDGLWTRSRFAIVLSAQCARPQA